MTQKRRLQKNLYAAALAGLLLAGGEVPLLADDLSAFEIYPEDSMSYRAFTGTLGGRIRVQVFLCRVDGEWEGSYFYVDRRLPLRLFQISGTGEARDRGDQGTIVLSESPMIGTRGSDGSLGGGLRRRGPHFHRHLAIARRQQVAADRSPREWRRRVAAGELLPLFLGLDPGARQQ